MQKTITEESSLLDIIQQMSPDSSKNTLRSWISIGRVLVDGRRVDRANTVVNPGQVVAIGHKMHFTNHSLRILHEDEAIVVVEKPEGLLSVATDFETQTTVQAILKKRFWSKRVYPVHRLDRETSGVMLFAYTEAAKEHIKDQFEQHLVEKTYFAVVENSVPTAKGRWECYLEEDDFYYVKSTSPSRGKLATTDYEVVSRENNRTLLRIDPKTGRKNQIRVHCSEAGHPIVGDKKYGCKTNPIKRVCLHAQKICLTHPITGRRVAFSVPLPEGFYGLFKNLKECP